MKNYMQTVISLVLAAMLAVVQPLSVLALDGGGTPSEGELTAAGASDWTAIKKPSTTDGVSTWDCIWFGEYWQDDTNGDGKCYAEETTVEGTTYPADEKQPIKWRVLDVDGSGNALLLADKLIDIVQYNETYTDVTWETCTMRSYLNGYDGSKNVCNKDFSEKSGNRSFVYSAFNDAEINCLINGEVNNPNNPVYGTTGGNTTHDWLFCLSLEEAMNGDYGFIKNEFTNPSSAEKKYYTDNDSSRVAVTTKFTDDKPDYNGDTAGTSSWWWLRSPGFDSAAASYVRFNGAALAYGNYVNISSYCLRPAFRMNLSSSSSLWKYAGTVGSDGTVKEPKPVAGVSLQKTAKVIAGKKLTLTPEFNPSDAADRTVTWKSSVPAVATVNADGVVTGVKEGTTVITVTTNDGGFKANCTVTVEPATSDPTVEIKKPATNIDGVTTWDCIWFGEYWQDDTNGDGYCYAEETTVEGTTYPADEKQPIKWRVLDIDDNGNALLLADKLIDIVQYNETYTDVTWETCTMRSYLNGYDGSKNVCNKDFSGDKSFLYNAFSETERNNIKTSDLENPDNPVHETSGGNATQDRIFILSLDEAMTAGYGFVNNKFTKPASSEKKYYTDDDPARVAVTTKFTDDKPGYNGATARTSSAWWLRSPGYDSSYASGVSDGGAAYASCNYVNYISYCLRPAFRMNLSSSSSLWKYAGTVGSDDKVVTGVSLQETSKVAVGKTITLTPEIAPTNAKDKTVTWESSAPAVATVDTDGVVTGVKEGTTVITVTTNDGGFTASCTVKVVKGLSLDEQKTIKKGKSTLLIPKIEFEPTESQIVTWSVAETDKDIVSVDDHGVVTALNEGTATVTANIYDEATYEASCVITVVGTDDITDPEIKEEKTTWDCIWFGEYWQDDTNGDGHCYAEETTVEGTTYPADEKQPIKWRVLDIDDNGNALLLADKLIDRARYNETATDVTWETCTLRSYLNGYGTAQNTDGKDFSGDKSFLYNAFSETERNIIKTSDLENADNPLYGTTGGKDTQDKIFCLSLDEAMTAGYGFMKNEFTGPDWEDKKDLTDKDPTRAAVATKFTGYYYNYSEPAWWWLRSPGYHSSSASSVDDYGAANAYGYRVSYDSSCVRPAFRMNLSSTSSLWSYAGTVSSDGTVNQAGVSVQSVMLTEQRTIKKEGSTTLVPKFTPSEAFDKTVSWKVSPEGETIISVDDCGVVTALKEGTAVVTVKTRDGGFESSCEITVVGNDDIADPEITGNKSTWDCILFGNYWLDTDSNQDEYVDREDNKYPVKWRVLDVDAEGNALLLSDKLIDIVEYNTEDERITWKGSTIRSFVNCYGADKNTYGTDYSYKGFLINAFSENEIKAITESVVVNDDNRYTGTIAGEDTKDRIFCLSIDEALSYDYGFSTAPKESFAGREAIITRYTSDKTNYDAGSAGEKGSWWLRSPGSDRESASIVEYDGAVDAHGRLVDGSNGSTCVRPAFRMNITSSSSLWSYAGTVSSDGTTEEPGTKKAVTGVSLQNTAKVAVGKTVTLTPVISPSNATDKKVTWKSSAPAVATVNTEGVVTGVKEGTAEITVTTNDGGFTASCTVTVESVSVSVTGVSLQTTAKVAVGKTVTLTPVISPSNATDKTVTWESSAPAVATVNTEGVVTGVKEGTAGIKVTTTDGGFTDSCTVIVEAEETPDDTLTTDYTLISGESRRLLFYDKDHYNYGVKWSLVNSNPKGCITVKNGVVTAKKAGKATVTAVDGDVSVTYNVIVSDRPPVKSEAITVGGKSAQIKATKTVVTDASPAKYKKVSVTIPKPLRPYAGDLTYIVMDENGTELTDEKGNEEFMELGDPVYNNKDVTMASKVSFDVIPFDADRNAAYIAWYLGDGENEEAEMTVAVTKVIVRRPLEFIAIEEDSVTLSPGEGHRLNVFWESNNTDPKELSFKASGKGIKVSKSGYVSGLIPGASGIVTVKSGRIAEYVNAKVDKTSEGYLMINKNSQTVSIPKPGKVKTVKLKVKSSDGYVPDDVTWTVVGEPAGIIVTDGSITITGKVSPGRYEVRAVAKDHIPAYCELIIR